MKFAFGLFALAFATTAQGSICSEVARRIGDETTFQNFIPNSANNPLVQLKKSREGAYLSVSGDRSGSFTLKDYALVCLLKAQDANSYFPQNQTWMLSVPNAKGECWVSMARISRLVPADQEQEFIKGGFCVSPLSYDPETSWLGTSAMTPARL